MKPSSNWSSENPKSSTERFINHVDNKYYRSYLDESDKYERIGNWLFFLITVIGFLTTILIGLKEILAIKNNLAVLILKILIFILPSVSSFLMIYLNQKGFKKKEELREQARIECKYLVNEAKIKFSSAQNDADYIEIYRWLNLKIKLLQINQSEGYLKAHNNPNTTS